MKRKRGIISRRLLGRAEVRSYFRVLPEPHSGLGQPLNAFLDSLPDQYVKGQPVKNGEPMPRKKPKVKHGRQKTVRH